MKKLFSLLLLALIMTGCAQNETKNNIIPVPVSITYSQGHFTLTEDVVFFADSQQEIEIAEFFSSMFQVPTGYSLKVLPKPENYSGKYIELDLQKGFDLKKEGYRLNVSKENVSVQAGDKAGLFYGMETFIQMLPEKIESKEFEKGVVWRADCAQIEDYPRFWYRGLHLDPCRHFRSVDVIKKQIEVMAMYKINTLHFHLTDDQGWRMEIKKYPKLTEVGAYRVEGEGFVHGGFYTQEELKEIVAFAAARQITVIPELEIPGHELAAISAYPHLSCTGKPITPRILWGVEDIVMCPGKEDMFVFLANVIKEMVEIFPSEYYHIGGDECPKVYWEKCPLCQKRIKDEGLDKTDGTHTPEQGLQSYVVHRVEKMLSAYGKKIIGWDEILQGGLAPTATVMSWQGEAGGIAAAALNHDVIMAPWPEGMYIDFFQGDSKIEPVSIGGYVPLEKTYSYDPIPKSLLDAGKEKYVIGVQTNSWSEYMYTDSLMEYRIYPRVLALSEIAWSPLANKDFKDFSRRIESACVRLDYHHINYHIPQPEQPYGSCNYVAFTDKALLKFQTSRPIKMVYTLDGSDPDCHSTEYRKPIEISSTTTLKICSVLPSGKTSPIRTIQVVKENLRPAASTNSSEFEEGMIMKVAQGEYLNSKALYSAPREWKTMKADSFHLLSGLIHTDEQMRDVPQYAALGDGYIFIPEDGVYYFSSNNNEVSIDGELIIDNNGEVKRYCRHDRSMALAKGYHKIDVMFLGHIIGGYASNWDSADVLMRRSDESEFSPLSVWRKK